ncbi:MAG: aspartate carbamoyltransferase regulatory subunit [Clostridia bacterium]|nr:aspartate carbamoyltransferase regulatory subunit [Clostridia bacterium]
MRIDSIKNGIVIDHIPAGKAMQLYNMLGLDALECPVAVLKNVYSYKLGKKDIIKIDSDKEFDMDLISFVCPRATVCIIRDEKVVEKKQISLPQTITDILTCKNPRCITTTEQGIHQIFRLTSPETGEYRCIYCDTQAK